MQGQFLALKYLIFQFGLIVSICYCHGVQAWTYKGHATLTQASYQQLSVPQKQYYRDLAKQLKSKYRSTNGQQVAILGTWADEIRDDSLQELFRRYRQPVPKSLLGFAKFPTTRWHYHNSFIQDDRLEKSGRVCKVKNKGELLDKLVVLDQLLFDPEVHLNKKQEAIILALQLHMLQDLHQPLHLLSQLDNKCRSDLGGNTACIANAKNGKCKLNLHAYWDKGFGVFDNVTELSITPQDMILRVKFPSELKKWAKQGQQYASVVYASDDMPLTKSYERQALKVVKKQAQLCVQRSVAYMQRYYKFRSQFRSASR